MSVPTVYVTHASVAMATDAALITFSSPSGPVKDGNITAEEASRLVLSLATLRTLSAIINEKLALLDEAAKARAADSQAGQIRHEIERRTIVEQEKSEHQPRHRLQ